MRAVFLEEKREVLAHIGNRAAVVGLKVEADFDAGLLRTIESM